MNEKNIEISKESYLKNKKRLDQRFHSKEIYNSTFKGATSSIKILDTGFGLGSMLIRVLENEFPKGQIQYFGLDMDFEILKKSKQYLRDFCKKRPNTNFKEKNSHISIISSKKEINLTLVDKKISNFASIHQNAFDYVIGNSFLDLIEIKDQIRYIQKLLRDKAKLYQTIVYDGYTRFFPEDKKDKRVLEIYNNDMEENGKYASNFLLKLKKSKQFNEIHFDSSDYLLPPPLNESESVYLKKILSNIRDVIRTEEIENWIENKIKKINKDEVGFLSHQLDLVAEFNEI